MIRIQIPTRLLVCIFMASILCSCQNENKRQAVHKDTGELFTLLKPSETKIGFRNSVVESNAFNFINYVYIYNGGGVAIGDINNDGLDDIYFSSNQGSNKLYLNKGNMVFEDITNASGTADEKGWSTGVNMVDINNDGLLDIYVCKSASRKNNALRRNKLFVNQGNNKFVESAAIYGLADQGFSTQSYFFDYDKDGDLDMYLVNHRADFINNNKMNADIQKDIVPEFSDKLFRNDIGRYSDISSQAGIANKNWGLSAAIADYNDDGWLDIYVCNDFTEPDQLWINNKRGGFEDRILEQMDHISYYSMGSDVADVNNDGKEDLIVVDMVSEDHKRSKQNMAAMSTFQFNTMVDNNYHHQYMANMLQLNRGNGVFSEIGHLAGVSKTDWSWAPLFADFDGDGNKDLFVTNGIKRDMTDNDYKSKLSERSAQGQMHIDEVFELVPSFKLANYIYRNKGNVTFENVIQKWGMNHAFNSNGAAYGDLDNDGDLDLVVNNLEDFSSVFQNNSTSNFLRINFRGMKENISGLGCKIEVNAGGLSQYYSNFLTRGFQSSNSPTMIVGLGQNKIVESLKVTWPDGKSQLVENIKANKSLVLDYVVASHGSKEAVSSDPLFRRKNIVPEGIKVTHAENDYNDFEKEILLPHKLSTLGPAFVKGDVNKDGLSDFFIGSAHGKPSSLYIQDNQGGFKKTNQAVFNKDMQAEDINALFFDADGDEDLDLYVLTGSNEVKTDDNSLSDRLYINKGDGKFRKSNNKLPALKSSGSVVRSLDFDNDGDLDLFVGGRVVPGKYPLPADSYLLENKSDRFVEVSDKNAPELKQLGLVTDAICTDYDGDGDEDILLVGEWMGLICMENNKGEFVKKELSDVSGIGWWYAIESDDIDNDGDNDLVLGNLGLNNKFGAKDEKPFHVFCDDFDGSGNLDIVLSKESNGMLLPVRGRECSSQQMPFIKEKFPTFKSFAEADLIKIYGEDELSKAIHYQANNFESILLINEGQGQYKRIGLPIEAQYGPTMDIRIRDVNGDGNKDIIGAGNIYNTEVETVRYDASKGYVLLGDGQNNFTFHEDSGFITSGNVKSFEFLQCGDSEYLVTAVNDGEMEFFELMNELTGM